MRDFSTLKLSLFVFFFLWQTIIFCTPKYWAGVVNFIRRKLEKPHNTTFALPVEFPCCRQVLFSSAICNTGLNGINYVGPTYMAFTCYAMPTRSVLLNFHLRKQWKLEWMARIYLPFGRYIGEISWKLAKITETRNLFHSAWCNFGMNPSKHVQSRSSKQELLANLALKARLCAIFCYTKVGSGLSVQRSFHICRLQRLDAFLNSWSIHRLTVKEQSNQLSLL